MAKSGKALLQMIDKSIEIFKAVGDYENGYNELNDMVANMATEYGFVSDHGDSFSKKYCGGASVPTGSYELKQTLDKVSDYRDIGSLYVSYWREVTHFMEADPFTYCGAFVTMLTSLKRAVAQRKQSNN